MNIFSKRLLLLMATILFLTVHSVGFAHYDMEYHEEPGAIAMVTDAAIARPLLLAATVLGAGVFVLTLPFSFFSGSTKQAAQTLVVTPAEATFNRCLGCNHSHVHHNHSNS